VGRDPHVLLGGHPFTLFTLSSNSNDALVSALVVFALLAIGSAPGGRILAALAGLTKSRPSRDPGASAGTGERPASARRPPSYWPSDHGIRGHAPGSRQCDLDFFWHDSVVYQASADAVLDLGAVGRPGGSRASLGRAVGLGILVAFVPGRRGNGRGGGARRGPS